LTGALARHRVLVCVPVTWVSIPPLFIAEFRAPFLREDRVAGGWSTPELA
jgi:hypothetical protein